MSIERSAQKHASRLQWRELRRRRIVKRQDALNVRLGLDGSGEPLVVPVDDPPASDLFPSYEDELKRQGAEFFRTFHLRLEHRWG